MKTHGLVKGHQHLARSGPWTWVFKLKSKVRTFISIISLLCSKRPLVRFTLKPLTGTGCWTQESDLTSVSYGAELYFPQTSTSRRWNGWERRGSRWVRTCFFFSKSEQFIFLEFISCSPHMSALLCCPDSELNKSFVSAAFPLWIYIAYEHYSLSLCLVQLRSCLCP